MHCPSCYSRLEIADRAGIEIDYCPSCRGVWLDRGELDKIIERTSQTRPVRMAATIPARGEYNESREKPKKKRRKKATEWIEDIFDIFD